MAYRSVLQSTCGVAVILAGWLTAGPAFAQTPESEIVVTGSRIQNKNFTSPTPVSVLSSTAIEDRAATNVIAALNELPAFRSTNSDTAGGSHVNFPQGVQAEVDLRGLDPRRTLVLINGHRHVPSNTNNSVDVSMIPVTLVDRVEVVTGGASAAYGSDAVAGVVNFILKNNLQGLQLRAQTGQTSQGDGQRSMISLAAGTSFAGDRGRLVVSGEWSDADTVRIRDRESNKVALIPVPAAQRTSLSLPANYFASDVTLAQNSPGGIIQGTATNGSRWAFDSNGTAYQYQPGTIFGTGNTAVMVGSAANPDTTRNGNFIQTANTRKIAYARASFDFTSNLRAFAEANVGDVDVPRVPIDGQAQSIIIPRTSLPASLQSQYTGTNVTLGKVISDNGIADYGQTLNVNRIVAGFEGKVGKWDWNVYANHGYAHTAFVVSGSFLPAYFKAAYGCNGLPSTAVGGNPNLTGTRAADVAIYEAMTGKTCSPMNPFGVTPNNSPSNNYWVVTDHNFHWKWTQDEFAGAISGSPFANWAGDVDVAAGANYRFEKIRTKADTFYFLKAFGNTNMQPFTGSQSVKEGFFETNIPLLKDTALAKSADLNAAIRYTDYSISGEVTTWKFGGTWKPNDELLFRTTRSRDIRAPNFRELYYVAGGTPGSVTNNIPGTFGFGVTSQIPTGTLGSTGLVPEEADTWTAGVTFQGSDRFLPGLRIAVDYYDIVVNDAIISPSAAQVQNACAVRISAGQTTCAGIIFNGNIPGTNGIAQLNQIYQNLETYKASGIDFEIDYRMRELPVPGSLRISLLLGHALENSQETDAGVRELAGSMNGLADWAGNLSFNYDVGKFHGTVGFNGFTEARYDTYARYPTTGTGLGDLIGPEDAGYATALAAAAGNTTNKVIYPGMVYTNLAARYDVTDNLQLFGSVSNLMDLSPPAFASIAQLRVVTGGPSGNVNYNFLGRAFTVGLAMKY